MCFCVLYRLPVFLLDWVDVVFFLKTVQRKKNDASQVFLKFFSKGRFLPLDASSLRSEGIRENRQAEVPAGFCVDSGFLRNRSEGKAPGLHE